jgi:DNA primase
MEILNDSTWNTYRKAESMGIRGNNTREVSSTQYAPNHIKAVVKEIGLKIISESNDNLVIYCPFHNNTHSPSFYISENNGAWLCFNPACGETGNIIQLVKKITGKNDFEAIRLVTAKEAQALDNFDEVLNQMLEEKPEFIEFDKNKLNELSIGLTFSKEARDYFEARGINHDSMSYFNLGYSETQGMVIVPVHSPDGIPVGLVGRSILEKKFKNSINLPKNKTLFNIHRAKKIGDHVIIVESSFDAIRVHQSGFPNVVATLGGHISNDNINLLNRYFNKITIMTDSDQAGRELGLSISSKLRNKDILWSSYSYGKIYPHDAKDAGDMTEEEIKICIKNAVSDIEYKSWQL